MRTPPWKTTWRRPSATMLIVALAVGATLAACSASDSTAPPASSASVPADPGTTATSTTGPSPGATPGSTAVADTEFCAAFATLAASRGATGAEPRNKDEAGWDRNIATVEHIAAVAPDEIATQADTYVQMVKDRKALASANGWADVVDLPADVRTAFIAEHAAAQREVNELLAYAKANCEGMR